MYNNYNPWNNIQFQSPLQQNEVVRVHGKDGANAYPLAPNSSILLLDETQPVVWCKMTDGAGFATIKGYTLTELTEEKPTDSPVYVTTKEFDELKEMVTGLKTSINAVLEDLK